MRALRHTPTVGGRCFFIPDDTPVINSLDLLEPYLNDRGYRLTSWSIPFPLIYAAFYVTETFLKLISPLYKINMSTPRCSLVYMNNSYTFNRGSAEKWLGYTPLYSYDDALKRSREYYRNLEI